MLTRKPILIMLLFAAVLIGGCGGGTGSSTDALAGDCSSVTGSAPVINPDATNGQTLADLKYPETAEGLSRALHDIADLAQIELIAQQVSYQFSNEITQNYQDNTITTFLPSVPCDNNSGSFTLNIQHNDPKTQYKLNGTTMTIAFDGNCRINNLRIDGKLDVTRLIPGQVLSDSWSISGEIWPTVTVHNSKTLSAINNPVSFNASINKLTGDVSVSGKVIDSGFGGTSFSGLVITHYPEGYDANNYPSDVLQNNFTITAYRNNLDPLAATVLSYSAGGKIISNLTGSDITSTVCTNDGTNSRPLTWLAAGIADAPQSPPSSGNLTITETETGSAIATAMNTTDTSGLGDMTLTVVDNTVPTNDPYHQQTVQTNWDELLSRL